MTALQLVDYQGVGSIQVGETERPLTADAGKILVRVHSAGLNPVDWQTSLGYLRAFSDPALPLTLGWDVAGEVTVVGDGVSGFAAGDEVMIMLGLGAGGLAEFVHVPADWAAHKPTNLTMADASVVPLVALTAWQALFDAGGMTGKQHALVHGAAGSVGRMAVQFAKLMGHRVTAVASGADRALLISLGADEVLAYDGVPFEQVVKDVDVVLDVLGGDIQARSWAVLRAGGVLVSTVGIQGQAPREDVSSKAFGVVPNGEQLRQIAELFKTGAVVLKADNVIAINDAPQALAEIQKRVRGGKTTVSFSR